MALATYGNLTYEKKTFYERVMLKRAIANFPYAYWGQQGVHPAVAIPEHEGDTIDWRLLAAFSAVTTPLTEGVTPSPQEIAISHDTATVAQYGAYVRYTRKLAAFGIDMVAAEASEALGEQSGDSMDQITRDVLIAGGTVQYASTAGDRDEITAAMVYSAAEVLEAVATLKAQNAKPIQDGKFISIIHPFTEYDILKDTTITHILNYGYNRGDQSAPWFSGFIGDFLGVRHFSSSNAKELVGAGASEADVFLSMIFGKGAFGIGGLAGEMPSVVNAAQDGNNTFEQVRPIRMIDKPFGSAGADDPLEQRASIAWYTTYVCKVLRDVFMIRLEHGTTLGS